MCFRGGVLHKGSGHPGFRMPLANAKMSVLQNQERSNLRQLWSKIKVVIFLLLRLCSISLTALVCLPSSGLLTTRQIGHSMSDRTRSCPMWW